MVTSIFFDANKTTVDFSDDDDWANIEFETEEGTMFCAHLHIDAVDTFVSQVQAMKEKFEQEMRKREGGA